MSDWLVVFLLVYGACAWLFSGMALATSTTARAGHRIPTETLAALVLGWVWPWFLLVVLAEMLFEADPKP